MTSYGHLFLWKLKYRRGGVGILFKCPENVTSMKTLVLKHGRGEVAKRFGISISRDLQFQEFQGAELNSGI